MFLNELMHEYQLWYINSKACHGFDSNRTASNWKCSGKLYLNSAHREISFHGTCAVEFIINDQA